MNQGPFVHSENDCLHAVGKNISTSLRQCGAAWQGRRAGVIWSHLGLELTQRGDGAEEGRLDRMQKKKMMRWMELCV